MWCSQEKMGLAPKEEMYIMAKYLSLEFMKILGGVQVGQSIFGSEMA
jgi:hypothetical protein